MYIHEYSAFDNIKSQMQVMSETSDLIVSSILLQSINPSAAIELGAGSGGWPKTMYTAGGIKECHWLLFEDFSWVKSNFQNDKFYWPSNADDFYNFVNSSAHGLHTTLLEYDVNSIKQNDVLSLFLKTHPGIQFDVLRLDCPIYWDIMEYYINLLSDTALVFIDDHRSNCGMQRIILGIDMVRKGLVFPVWFGEKEAVYCKNEKIANKLKTIITELIPANYNNIFPVRQNHMIGYDEIWEFVATTGYKVFTTNNEGI